MLRRSTLKHCSKQCRGYAEGHGPRFVPILRDGTIDTFRREAFEPALPALLPRKHFIDLPAVQRWFGKPSKNAPLALNTAYLSKFGATIVPLEISNNDQFARIEQSLSFFLECVQATTSRPYKASSARYFSSFVPGARAVKRTDPSNDFFSASSATMPTAKVYLAQAPIADLPRTLAQDVPIPEVVLKAGKGDVYDSSIWLGHAPTYTPLHRDPNPNLFVQLAGRKVVRLFRPQVGQGIFAKVQEKIGASGSATIRGEEMMQGVEKKVLEEEVWHEESASAQDCWEAELHRGDAIFIPKGWWHSVKGIGKGMTGSVNWWFR